MEWIYIQHEVTRDRKEKNSAKYDTDIDLS